MKDEERKKLNDKLLEFVGFRRDGELRVVCPAPSYKVIPTPDFTDPEFGIAYCFKWLVPKLGYFCLQTEDSGGFYADVSIGEEYAEYYQAETPALALCLAVEKLTNGKERS